LAQVVLRVQDVGLVLPPPMGCQVHVKWALCLSLLLLVQVCAHRPNERASRGSLTAQDSARAAANDKGAKDVSVRSSGVLSVAKQQNVSGRVSLARPDEDEPQELQQQEAVQDTSQEVSQPADPTDAALTPTDAANTTGREEVEQASTLTDAALTPTDVANANQLQESLEQPALAPTVPADIAGEEEVSEPAQEALTPTDAAKTTGQSDDDPETPRRPQTPEPADPMGVLSSDASDGSLTGGWTDVSTWKDTFHVYHLGFWIHVGAATVGTVVSVKFPVTLALILAASGLLWPISWYFGLDLWEPKHAPMTADWWMTFIKWLIVDAAAALPILAVKGLLLSEAKVQRVGDWIYCVLGANILWTMFYKVDGWVRCFNTLTGAFLVISLTVHCVAMRKYDKELVEMRHGFPYGRGTPVSWLFCYTFWNAMFLADFSIQMTLQDFLFWGMMFGMQWLDKEPHTIDLYFCFARPVQLGIYIPIGCWMGIIPLFAQAKNLEEHTPLDINGHAYFLFIVMCNFGLSLTCTFFAFQNLIMGFSSSADRFKRTLSIARPSDQSSPPSSTVFHKAQQ